MIHFNLLRELRPGFPLLSLFLFRCFFLFLKPFSLDLGLKLLGSDFHCFALFGYVFAEVFDNVVRQQAIVNNQLISDARQVFVVAGRYPGYRILLDPLKHCNAHRAAHILKDFDRIVWRSYIPIEFRIAIRKLILHFNTQLVKVVLRCQRIDAPTCLIVTLQSVRIDQSGSFVDADPARAFSTKATASILSSH